MSSSDAHRDEEILHSGDEEDDTVQHPDSEDESGGEQDPELGEENPEQDEDTTPDRWDKSSATGTSPAASPNGSST